MKNADINNAILVRYMNRVLASSAINDFKTLSGLNANDNTLLGYALLDYGTVGFVDGKEVFCTDINNEFRNNFCRLTEKGPKSFITSFNKLVKKGILVLDADTRYTISNKVIDPSKLDDKEFKMIDFLNNILI
jgi:acyl-CoA-binding protein